MRNAAYLIYSDCSKVNDTVLSCKLAELKKGLVREQSARKVRGGKELMRRR